MNTEELLNKIANMRLAILKIEGNIKSYEKNKITEDLHQVLQDKLTNAYIELKNIMNTYVGS